MQAKCSGIIVDDEKDLVETYTEYLQAKGFDIKGKAYNGCDAATVFEETHPDFVILDMKMPQYDGPYAIQKIKERDPKARIFVVTGHTEYSFEDGEVEAVFRKPVDLRVLSETVCKSVN